jgi:hypothetical protein
MTKCVVIRNRDLGFVGSEAGLALRGAETRPIPTPDRCGNAKLSKAVLPQRYAAICLGRAANRLENVLASHLMLREFIPLRGLTGGASAASEEPKAMSESAARAC